MTAKQLVQERLPNWSEEQAQRALDAAEPKPETTGDTEFVPAHIEIQDGFAVIVPEEPIAPLTVEETRAAIDRVRR